MLTPDEIRKGRALADLARLDPSNLIRLAFDDAEKLNHVEALWRGQVEYGTYSATELVDALDVILHPNKASS